MKVIFLPALILMVLMPSCFMFPAPKTDDEPPFYFETNSDGKGQVIEIGFVKGTAHYFPLMAIWMEDTLGNFVQTLYVAESIAIGVFGHGDASTGKWMPGEIRRPAALPYWGHRRGIQAEDGLYLPSPENPLPDAYTGATPPGSFVLRTRADEPLEKPFHLFFEVNQSWDWNRYWTNNRYPGDMDYHSSAQPALVYKTMIDPNDPRDEYIMEPEGRSHQSGATGELFDDLYTLTTALNIAERITVKFNF